LLIVDDILWIAGMEKLKRALYTVEFAFAICRNPGATALLPGIHATRVVCF
jgi:hypothetical protein